MKGTVARALVVAGLVATPGCTSTARPPATEAPPTVSPVPVLDSRQDPARLVGAWYVESSETPAGTVLVVGDKADGGLVVFARCGQMSGPWRANTAGRFIADLDGFDSACATKSAAGTRTPVWLRNAVAFRADGHGFVLLDDHATVVARLVPGRNPSVGPNASPDFGIPALTPALRTSFAVPARLPSGVTPATVTDLLGRWVPVDRHPAKAYVAFNTDGTYTGSDGCNGTGGGYVVGSSGVILATAGVSTLVGCLNSPVSHWPAQAGRVGLRSGLLTFYDPRGHLLGEARHV